MLTGISPPDPYVIDDSFSPSNRDTNGKALRSPVINPGIRTLVLLSCGESNRTTINPTAYAPTSASVIDNLNVFDGAIYNGTGAALGTPWVKAQGNGNLLFRVADKLIAANKTDRVIIGSLAVGSTTIAMWATGAQAQRFPVAMRRLAAMGITPSTPGVTMALEMALGSNDNAQGTTSSSWQASFATFAAAVFATGFNGKIYVPTETWNAGAPSATIQAAQAAVLNGTTIVQGANSDSLNNTYRQADQVHFNDTGADAEATLIAAKF